MDRRTFLAGTGAVLLAAPLAEAQADRVARVGLLLYTASLKQAPELREALRQGLREHGWVEGQNIVIEERWADGKAERLAKLAVELVRLKVDVLVAPTPYAALAAKKSTRTTPIVMIVVDDPVQAGLVGSLARPGGNITGLTAAVDTGGIIGKQLELLTQSVPDLSRVALSRDPAHPLAPSALVEAERAARLLRLRLQAIDVRGLDDLENAFAAVTRDRMGAILVSPRMLLSYRDRFAALAAKHRVPAIFGFRQWVEAGGLMAYGPDFSDLFRRVGAYVDKILKGSNPADLPVEQPTKFELVINLKTAKALGLTIPPSLLGRADEIIQ